MLRPLPAFLLMEDDIAEFCVCKASLLAITSTV
jgi:hypothetical protein